MKIKKTMKWTAALWVAYTIGHAVGWEKRSKARTYYGANR